jgi:5-methylcytosine-specific restriction endonuclease McrA
MNRHYAQVAGRAGQRCEYCHAPEAIFNLPFEVEHIVPTARGGADEESNLALACRACNLYKSDQQSGADETTREVVPLFHPRHDRWDEHFRVEPENGEIRGLTPIGRITVACLRMNREVAREARRSWIRLKLYP